MAIRNSVRILSILIVGGLVMNCGVKGDPLPPERPAELGRGRPTFKRAAERVKIVPQPKEVLDQDEDEESENEEGP